MRQIEEKASFWRRRWLIRFHPLHRRANRIFALKVTPLRVVLLALLLWLPLSGLFRLVDTRHARARQKVVACQQQIEKLQKYNRALVKKLRVKEHERTQIAMLATEKSRRLKEDMSQQERQIRQLWSAIGRRSSTNAHRQSLKGSRGGGTVNAARGSLAGSGGTVNSMSATFARIERELAVREAALVRLRGEVSSWRRMMAAQASRERESRTPDMWPVEGRIVSDFGYRRHPVTGAWSFHSGIDIDAPHGAPIYSAAAGTVTHSAYRGGFGNTVIIDHGNGHTTLYAHCSSLAVSTGRRVSKGALIALVGSTGLSTGSHLHFEVTTGGCAVNPAGFLVRRRGDFVAAAISR